MTDVERELEYERAIELVHSMRGPTAAAPKREAVRHWSLPLGTLSGDFHCAAEHPDLGWFAMLADAAGHGLPAAILGLRAPDIFHGAVMRGCSLEDIYLALNQFLVDQHLSHYFVCCTLVRMQGLDLEVLNAGMPDGLLLSHEGLLLQRFASRNLPVGLDDGKPVVLERYRLLSDQRATLLLCSDGLTELQPRSGPPFAIDNLLTLAAAQPLRALENITAAIAERCERIHDDISIVEVQLPFAARPLAEQLLPARAAMMDADTAWLAALVTDSLDSGVVVTDVRSRILYVNQGYTRITGYSAAEAVGQTPRLLRSGRHGPQFYQAMWREVAERGAWSGEIWNRRKDGNLYLEWLEIRVLATGGADGPYYVGLMSDITRRRLHDERLRHSVLHDTLTGLANRTLLHDRGGQEISRALRSQSRLGVLVVKLDRFNSALGSLGHEVGDEILRDVAHRLWKLFRDHDTLARSGDHEFVGLLPDLPDPEAAASVAAKVLHALNEPIKIAGHRLRLSASIGIALCPNDGDDLDALLHHANTAMRGAREAGGNLYRFFAQDMARSADRALYVEARLHEALGKGELELHYQPKMDLASGRMNAVEALIRWRDPLRGLIPPAEFIPIAERSALIAEIGSFVLREACAMLARLRANGHSDMRVAVNVSPLQLLRHDLVAEVREALAAEQVPADRLELEVTESIFIRDLAKARVVFAGLAEIGVSLALDDFGSGYSSLGYLRQLPFNTLKVDQAFIRDLHTDRYNASITRAAMHLADGLDLQVIAEGVESCEECLYLKQLGCHSVQGFHFAKPMLEADLLAFMAQPAQCCCACQVRC